MSDYTEGDTVEVDLRRACTTVKTVVGVSDEQTSEGSDANVEIFTDDVNRFSGTTTLGQTTPLSLDVRHVLRLRIVATKLPSPDDGNYSTDAYPSLGSPQALCRF